MGIFDEEEEFKIQDPKVMDYLTERRKIAAQNEQDASGPNWLGGLAALGAGLQGGDALSAGQNFVKTQQAGRDKKLTDFDAQRDFDLKEQKIGQDQEKLARESDPNSEDSKLAQQAAIEMGVKPELASKLTAAKFREMSPIFSKQFDIRQSALARQDAQRAQALARADAREARMSEKQLAREIKNEDRELALAVPGFERTGEVLAKPEEAAKIRKATVTAQQLTNKLSRVKDLVDDVGSFEYGGEKGAEMAALATEIQLLGKSPEMYELGVLTGPDLKLLEKITADPESLSSMFTRDSTRKKQIDTQLKSIVDKLSATTAASGYKPKADNPLYQAQIMRNMENGGDEDARAEARRAEIAALRAKTSAGVARK